MHRSVAMALLVVLTGCVKFVSEADQPKPQLATPQGLAASHGLWQRIALEWESVHEAASYTVHRASAAHGDFSVVGDVANGVTAFVDEPPGPSQTFFYYVVAHAPGYPNSEPSDVAVGWTLSVEFAAYVKSSATVANHHFGRVVALSGDGSTLAVASQAADCIGQQPKIFLYSHIAGGWDVDPVVHANPSPGNCFGSSLALSADGDALAVGARLFEVDENAVGGAYLYQKDNETWQAPAAPLQASNAGDGDNFGWSVAMSLDGSTLAVGAFTEDGGTRQIDGEDDDSATNAGAVYIFEPPAVSSTYVKTDGQTATTAYNNLGHAVALSFDGDTLAVGAPGNDKGGNDSGAVHVLVRVDNSWTEQAFLKAATLGVSDKLGESLALSADGNTLVVGAPGEDGSAAGVGGTADDAIADAGAAYVFRRDGVVWQLSSIYLKAAHPGDGDQFGSSVAISADGNTILVGAPFEDGSATGIDGLVDETQENAGAAYLYRREQDAWVGPVAYLKASNTGTGDRFGSAVALSADGRRLAVGAPGEGSNASGIDGDQANNDMANAGAVYVFDAEL